MGTIAGLAIGTVVAIIAAWNASQYFGEGLARTQAQIEAATLHRQVINSLSRGYQAFEDERTEYADQKFFQRFVRASAVYRVSLISKEGRVFWSTKTTVTGDMLTPDDLNNLAGGSDPILQLQTVQAAKVDQMMRRMPFGEYDPRAERKVATVKTPVMEDGEFLGVVELRIDSTNIINLFAEKMNFAAASIGAFLAVVFLLAGFLFIRSARARQDSVLASAVADEARKSEAEAREMAEQLTRVNEEVGLLNRSLEDNFKQLSDAQDELVRNSRLAQMGELTATVAHEIRNPLGAVRSSAFLIKRQLDKLDIDLSRPLDRIDNGIARCDKIISELLDFTRVDELRRETLNFDDWVMNAVHEQSEQLPQIVRVECELGLGELEAKFDGDRMLRVLANMLANASQAMVGKSGESEDVSIEHPLIKISSLKTDRGIEFKVTDNGPGMDAETLIKIFEPFYSTKGFGIGLGVPAMQKVLQQHGGDLEYESEVGKGTTATAWFPLEFEGQGAIGYVHVPDKFKVPDRAKSA